MAGPAVSGTEHDRQEIDRLSREIDQAADVLTQRGIPCPRSKPLGWAVAQLADELARTRRMLAHAVIWHGEDSTIAFAEEMVAVSARERLAVYENRERGLVVMSRIDISEGDQSTMRCPSCAKDTSIRLPVCLQCGRNLYPAEREDAVAEMVERKIRESGKGPVVVANADHIDGRTFDDSKID
jgi:uncharacterized protein with PIN domain